jgi:hypothetical protein
MSTVADRAVESSSDPLAPKAAAPPARIDAAHLLRLVRRVAQADRRAFAELYDAVAPGLGRTLVQAMPKRAAAATLSATFVEVWSVARFHTGADTDVGAWISGIAARRASDRTTATGPTTGGRACAPTRTGRWWSTLADVHDRRADLALTALLSDHHAQGRHPSR